MRSPSTDSSVRFSFFFSLLGLLLLTGCVENGFGLSQLSEMAKHLPQWQVATVIAFATLITEDVSTIVAGILAANGLLTVFWALTGSLVGVLGGDFGLYVVGYFGGMNILKRAPMKWWVKEESVKKATEMFEQHGAKLIFTSRFLPGTRFPLYLTAGILRYPFWKYFIYLTVACTTSTVALLYLAIKLGTALLDYLKVYETYALPVFISVVLIVWLTVKLIEIMATRQSRLRFLAKWRSIWRRLRGRKQAK